MTQSIVIQALEKSGKTAGMIAQQLNIKPRTVFDTIYALPKKGSQRVRIHIAYVVGRSPSALWYGLLPADKLAADDVKYMDFLRQNKKP